MLRSARRLWAAVSLVLVAHLAFVTPVAPAAAAPPFASPMFLGSATVATTYTNLDPGDKTSTITLSNSNLTAAKNATTGSAFTFGSIGKETGKWRFQVTVVTATNEFSIGLTGGLFNSRNTYLGGDGASIAINHGGAVAGAGVITSATTQYGTGLTLPAGTVVDVYVDLDASKVWFAKDGTVLNGDPALGTGGTTMTSAMKKAWYPTAYLSGANSSVTFNFGASPWTFAGVSGFPGWSAVAGTTFGTFRSAAMFVRSLGNFSHAMAEFELTATSGGANVLSGATVTSSLGLTGGSFASLVDGSTSTFAAVGNTGTHDQANAFFYFELGTNATRNVVFAAVRGRDGGGGAEQQAPTLFDLWLSTGTVSTGSWYRAKTAVSLSSYAATTPGERKEFAVP
jgi:hypothetical protein